MNDEMMQQAQALIGKIKEYAASFTPEWNFNLENPDSGAALALIFAEQMAQNIEKYNTLLEYYQEKFNIDMPEVSRRPPRPSHVTVLVQLIKDSVPGFFLTQGTKFLAQGEEDSDIIFESTASVYITEAVIDTIFMKSYQGEVRLIQGVFYPPALRNDESEPIELGQFTEIPLFHFEKDDKNVQRLFLFHDFLFQGNKDCIIINISGGKELISEIENGRFQVFCQGEEGLKEIENFEIQGENLLLTLPEKISASPFLMLQTKETLETDITAERICLSARGGKRSPQFVCTDSSDCGTKEFLPFSDVLMLYNQCYIGCDSIFSRKGAAVFVEFELDFGEHHIGEQKKADDNRKIIKKRSYDTAQKSISETFAEEVVFEYYNGRGWKNLPNLNSVSELFYKKKKRRVSLSFVCPWDWVPTAIGAYEGRCIRIRLIRAENCYLQPCIHYYPIIRNMNLSYNYKEVSFLPLGLERLYGMEKTDLTEYLQKNLLLPLFNKAEESNKNRLYLGFDRPLLGGPVNLWIQKKEEQTGRRKQISFSYYSRDGWKRLKAEDRTDGLSRSGIIRFLPPNDMDKLCLYAKERYYLCIEAEKDDSTAEVISNICFNGVETKNRETEKEEEYYIDVSKPNMSFSIQCNGLLELDVWVNETGEYSQKKMKELLKNHPDEVSAEYHYSGEISRFYVKWKEIQSFEASKEARVYRLDRQTHKIIFGDGIQKRIPKITGDVAFKVVAYRCRGELANVEKEAVYDLRTNILYVDRVYNPLPAYGGSHIETKEAVLKRGAGIYSSHGRLITEADYIREIKGFSDHIHKVKCLIEHGKMTIILLMKDYAEGSASFHAVKPALMMHLISIGDFSILPEQIMITEPLFAEIHTCIWLDTRGFGDIFELTAKIQNTLKEYLDPISGKDGQGWEPGVFPRYSQIIMKINEVRQTVSVKRVMATVRYKDKTGIHECGLEQIKENFTWVVKSGEHKIYTKRKKGGRR